MLETTSNKIVYEIKSDSKIFAFPIRFFQPSDIVCYLDNVELENGVDFSVETKTDYSSGANITLNIPVSAGSKLAILRILPEIQETSLPEYGKLPSSSLEKQLDKIVMICQQLKEVLDRAVVLEPTDDLTVSELVSEVKAAYSYAVQARYAMNSALASKEAAAGSEAAAKAAAESAEDNAQISQGVYASIEEIKGNLKLNEVHLNFGRRIGEESSCIFGRRV